MRRFTLIARRELVEVVWDGDAEVERDAKDEEVARRVHVCELHEGEPHSTC